MLKRLGPHGYERLHVVLDQPGSDRRGYRGTPNRRYRVCSLLQRFKHPVGTGVRQRISTATPNDQGVDSLRSISSYGETNLASHRVAEVVGSGNIEIIQDSGDVGDAALPVIGIGLVGLVARTMATGVDQNEPIVRLQPVDIS